MLRHSKVFLLKYFNSFWIYLHLYLLKKIHRIKSIDIFIKQIIEINIIFIEMYITLLSKNSFKKYIFNYFVL